MKNSNNLSYKQYYFQETRTKIAMYSFICTFLGVQLLAMMCNYPSSCFKFCRDVTQGNTELLLIHYYFNFIKVWLLLDNCSNMFTHNHFILDIVSHIFVISKLNRSVNVQVFIRYSEIPKKLLKHTQSYVMATRSKIENNQD